MMKISETRKKILHELCRGTCWIILSHTNPDGDTLGSASALFSIGKALGKRCFWVGSSPVPGNLLFLPHMEEYKTSLESLPRELSPETCLIAVDISHEKRAVAELLPWKSARGYPLIVIDHHGDNSLFGDINYIDPQAPATGEMIFSLAEEASWTLTQEGAEAIYTAIATDTGNFRYSRTTSNTHRIVSTLLELGVSPSRVDKALQKVSLSTIHLYGLGLARTSTMFDGAVVWTWLGEEDFKNARAHRKDIEGLSSHILNAVGVDFAMTFYKEEGKELQISLRSQGAVSAREIAQTLGGGGHPAASGCSTPLSLDAALNALKKALEHAYEKLWDSSSA